MKGSFDNIMTCAGYEILQYFLPIAYHSIALSTVMPVPICLLSVALLRKPNLFGSRNIITTLMRVVMVKNIAKDQKWNEFFIIYIVGLLIRDYISDSCHSAFFGSVYILARLIKFSRRTMFIAT